MINETTKEIGKMIITIILCLCSLVIHVKWIVMFFIMHNGDGILKTRIIVFGLFCVSFCGCYVAINDFIEYLKDSKRIGR